MAARPKRDRGVVVEPWWRNDAPAPHDDVFAWASFVRRSSRGRRREDVHHMQLYGNLDVAGQGYVSDGWSGIIGRGRNQRMRYNVVASAVDTAASLIAQNVPRPMYLTYEGDYAQQRQAQLRTAAIVGQLHDCDIDDLGPEVFVDAAVTGTGAIYGYLDDRGEPRLERVLPLELLVDHVEALAGKPRTIVRQKLVDRAVLAAIYPKFQKEILEASGPDDVDTGEVWLSRDTSSDQVVVLEGWHLPSGRNTKDGKRIVAVDTATLLFEDYDQPHFPFAFYRWKKRQLGFWGSGIVEEARDAQVRINHLIQKTERMSDLGSNMWILVERGSEVKVDQLSNVPGSIIRYTGAPPQVVTTNGVPTQLFQEIANIREELFSQLGISTMAAEAKKPPGLNSGMAQRAHDDITSRRHIVNAKRYERFHLDVAALLERLNEQASQAGKTPELTAEIKRGGSTLVKSVKWSDLRMPKNRYRMRVYPTSALPTTPQGKWSAVQEWISAGLVSPEMGKQLLDFPDLDAGLRLELADYERVLDDVDAMLGGDDRMPDPAVNLELAIELVRRSYLAAQTNGAEDAVQDSLRDYMERCHALLESTREAPPAEPPPGPMPDAAPEQQPPAGIAPPGAVPAAPGTGG